MSAAVAAAALSPLHFKPRRLCRAAGADPPPGPPRSPKHCTHGRNPRQCWDDFYKRHRNKFFKDRHYIQKDWGRYFEDNRSRNGVDRKVVLEVGCGAGNTLFPVRLAYPEVFIHACDFSHHAIALVKEHETFSSSRVNAFICDVSMDDLRDKIMPASVDVITMIFMLSAVSPVKMPLVLQNVKAVLKPSGHLLFRDYAEGDFAQEKLADKNQKISENFYVRGDGTRAFYFSEDSLSTLFEGNGFSPLAISVYCKEIVNRTRKVSMSRRWICAEFCRRDDRDSPQSMTD